MGEDVAEPVADEGDARLQKAEYPGHGGSHGALGRGRPSLSGARVPADLGQVAEVRAFGGVELQRVGKGVDDGTGRVAVASLFDSGEVLDADPGPGGQLRTA
jgi:hypothetical protein